MMKRSADGIFISYRRADASGHAGRLYDHLSSHFGARRIFMDVQTIGPGADFIEEIRTAIAECRILIALIGNEWLHASRPDGQPRIMSADDFVRLEIEQAIERGLPILPVLVKRATMPSPAELPPSLESLTRRHALELDDSRWEHDAGRIISAIERLTPAASRRSRIARTAALLLPLLLAIVVLVVWIGSDDGGQLTDEPMSSSDPAAASSTSPALVPPSGSSPAAPIETRVVRHPAGTLHAIVPASWSDTEVTVWRSNEDQDLGPLLLAAPDVDEFYDLWGSRQFTVSGLWFSVSDVWLEYAEVSGEGAELATAFLDRARAQDGYLESACKLLSVDESDDGPTADLVKRADCGGSLVTTLWQLHADRTVVNVLIIDVEGERTSDVLAGLRLANQPIRAP